MTEDVTDIALNLKQVELKSNISELPKTFLVNIAEKTELVAEDLFPGPEIKVLNPRLHIASLAAGTKLQIELTVNRGFGYVSEDRITAESEEKEKKIGTIQLAAAFSPVTRVAYHTETARVGQRVDYERLILEIWTTGAIEPKQTVIIARDILKQHLDQVGGGPARAEAPAAAGVSLEKLGLATRIRNVLKAAGIETDQALAGRTEAELEAVEGLGEKSLEELKKFMAKKKLKLKEA
ncbi:MAG: DNA-directed RNA polymerase subunit alpha [candidate division TA06 bacterium ADurb.Bin417]|uniref:DNA-directed RNA polymerase subunit alpha n=1 Tax=candidate division TA06 bacterium ADurb.Bin417 TaxID=1852828 RepID=A0A1V5MD58_UNCT6|nr:MAG: DNA-directed RNA polymerase subunit alpha [candidate division TA06 bacterium ADurb.Bin417]